MTPVQRPTKIAPLRRPLAGAALFGLVLIGFCGAVGAEPASRFTPTASGYFLSSRLPPADGKAGEKTRLGTQRFDVAELDAAEECDSRTDENPFCGLRWTTARTRGSDLRARYYEMEDSVKARIVGNSRAEYFDLDLDTSPEFRFKLRF